MAVGTARRGALRSSPALQATGRCAPSSPEQQEQRSGKGSGQQQRGTGAGRRLWQAGEEDVSPGTRRWRRRQRRGKTRRRCGALSVIEVTPTKSLTSCHGGVSRGTACRLCLAPDPCTVKIAVTFLRRPMVPSCRGWLVGTPSQVRATPCEKPGPWGGRNCPVPRAARRGGGPVLTSRVRAGI